ncbi:queuosine salvage protein [Neodiprion virginianus]|uniref:queuosine salvage protein n=1 Tax=Neodiprion virginianus TaxID=2961670 RepID=UPI001EE69CD1|nr:queuosine salvage protein [Neodiprion virginianus]
MATQKTLNPRESAKLIASLSTNVFIEKTGIQRIAQEVLRGLKSRDVHIDNFSQHNLHPSKHDPRTVDWIFLLDTLNFCFWPEGDDTKWEVTKHTGYFALCAALKRAISQNQLRTEPFFYSAITKEDLEFILQGDNASAKIPLFMERLKCLHEIGRVLTKKYYGSFVNCIYSCKNSAEKLLKLIVTDFECFRDEADYKGHRVSFYKRAQILIGDIWACYGGKGLGEFHDIDKITMFADYRVPQVLVHFGAMRYSKYLLEILQSNTVLPPGSPLEVEIRGCSIEVIEQVKDEVKSLIEASPDLALKKSDCNAILIDHFLWDYRRQHAENLESIPFHKVKSIYY